MSAKRKQQFDGLADTYTEVGRKGEGGSGVIYEVTDSDGRTCALKLLKKSGAPKGKFKRFINEMNFCRQGHSEHIVRVLDSGRCDDGSVFYVMPFYPRTLQEIIDAGIAPEKVLPVFGQLLDGVEAAHLLGVCHRDIKPANFLCDVECNQVVLADFGIADLKEDELYTLVETKNNERLANFVYAAPEQRVRGRQVGPAADIYALGLILNQMFTGHVPEGTGIKLIAQVAPEFGYLDELVEVMRRQQPDQRPSTIRTVKDELIARRNQFIEWQRLDQQKKIVVPATEVNDPIIADPIRAIEKVDYENQTLVLRLNQPVNEKWKECFYLRATAFSTNFSANQIAFHGDKVHLLVNSHFVDQAVNYFKEYSRTANEEYAQRVVREHATALAVERTRLQQGIEAKEAKLKLLSRITL